MDKSDKDDLSTSRAEEILGLRKEFEDRKPLEIRQGSKVESVLTAVTEQLRLGFDLTFYEPGRFSFQVRLSPRSGLVLARLDVGGRPHRNPKGKRKGKGKIVPAPHLHLYRKGCGAELAYPVEQSDFRDISDMQMSYDDFCAKFNIGKRPKLNVEE